MTTVATERVASRTVAGTEYTVERWQPPGGKTRWTVVTHLHPGVPQGAEDFMTRKAAMARLTELTKED